MAGNTNRVGKYNKEGNFVRQWGSTGTENGQFRSPRALAIDASGNVYVADSGNKRIQVFDGDGTFKSQITNIGSPLAMCMTTGATQYLYVSHSGDKDGMVDQAILKVALDGKVVGRFGTAGRASMGLRMAAADHLVSEAIYLTDPDGLGIEVYCDRPRENWDVRGQELVMATEPLDLMELVRASDDLPWQGAPLGTTMGHVHLHVGNLEKGEAFYHRALGFDKMVWSYPGALFLSAGGYHHHLGANTWPPGPAASDEQARLLEWELVLPSAADAAAAAGSLAAAGYETEADGTSWTVRDPWGTRLRIAPAA